MREQRSDVVSWRDFALWRDDLCRVWGKSVVVTMAACAAGAGQSYADRYIVWATPLCGRMPNPDDPHVAQVWPNERFLSVPAMLIWCVIELDRTLKMLEEERRSQQTF
jgi:hypothetical protein